MCYRQPIEWKCPDCGKKARENSLAHTHCPNSSACQKIQLKLRPQMRFTRRPCAKCEPEPPMPMRRVRNKISRGGNVAQVVVMMDPFDGDDEMGVLTVNATANGPERKQNRNEVKDKDSIVQHGEKLVLRTHHGEQHPGTAAPQHKQEVHGVEHCATAATHLGDAVIAESERKLVVSSGGRERQREHRPLEFRPRHCNKICRPRHAVQEHHGLPLSAPSAAVLNNWFRIV
ncbi:hypothetical protein Z517_04874 [Fonsecaea pedrosoi CBS 271.37]|uniref:Uncharacterized protein n=1 Tax=Fonsecaea pedrosoi CBS 271.37 TaxID=1442368 RepID=A0A0D2GLM6_9EURO|nr:uncharacterized protein Z517_04874 [Fonsecaea pedrosoi CBS 271.37]KIW81848.1 hypothetical protein Z517_04874 [Fonsecaea pedrosoi CBS 271.37]